MTSPDPVALQPWEYRRMEERILSMSQGVPGQNFDGDQFKREQGWRDSVDAKLADIGKQLADLAAKPSGVTGTFPVTGNVKVG